MAPQGLAVDDPPRTARSAVMAMMIQVGSPMWMMVTMTVVFLIIAISSSRRRKDLERRRWDVKVCRQCGASHPAHAAYCRNCGQRV
jgi:ribosomal protein L40E